jgi:hypothetical protein
MVGIKLRFRLRKPRELPTISPAVMIALTALKESSDAFPPLKSVVAGVLHIVDLSQKVKSNKEECQKLASRVQEMLDKIAVAVPDATCISYDLLVRVNEFARTLADIECFMKSLCRLGVVRRLLHHKEHEALIVEFNRRLDEALKSFMLISTIKIEMSVSQQRTHLEILSDEHKELIHQNQLLQKKLVLVVLCSSFWDPG